MTNIWLVGIIVFFMVLLVNRSIMSSALRKLDDETKLRYIEVFTRRGNLMTFTTVALVIVYLLGTRMFPGRQGLLTIVYGVLLTCLMVVKFVINFRKLKSIRVPPEYFRSFFAAYAVFIAGIGLAACGMWVYGAI